VSGRLTAACQPVAFNAGNRNITVVVDDVATLPKYYMLSIKTGVKAALALGLDLGSRRLYQNRQA